jgi:hypothetical protein
VSLAEGNELGTAGAYASRRNCSARDPRSRYPGANAHERKNEHRFSLANLVGLSMTQREREAEQSNLIEAQTCQAENEE